MRTNALSVFIHYFIYLYRYSLPACIKPTKPECPVADSNCTQVTQTCEQPRARENSMDRTEIPVEFNNVQPSDSVSVGIDVSLPDICIEKIKHSSDLIMFYTGFIDFKTFQAVFDSLMEHGADKLSTESVGEMNIHRLGRKRKLRHVDEFLMVMMTLRLGLLVKDLEYRFKISASAVSKIFNSWVLFMCECMQSLVVLPKLDVLQASVPKCFEKFSDTRIILDCTEVYIQSPSSLENKSLTYSSYKSHDTFKALVGVSMTGAVVLVSKLWHGSTSDVEITRKSCLFEQLNNGDAVMVDKGFIHIQSDLKPLGVKLYCPPLKFKTRFSKTEVETTRRIASARIHVERKMEQIKNYRILQGVLPLAISDFADHIFFLCSAMTNLLPPLVSE